MFAKFSCQSSKLPVNKNRDEIGRSARLGVLKVNASVIRRLPAAGLPHAPVVRRQAMIALSVAQEIAQIVILPSTFEMERKSSEELKRKSTEKKEES
ncbi:hypothetical protein AVEN_84382-1 [Araneus ventricosus]|uniref:Uncharacterized protein n=1 Tax=Araneus ventricosus TaxID=182803 RepID=A0A4Y2R5N9_ARAVE|nr:hypothetical protein AVEN_84382-1 [Araneus ventricosus]